MAGSTEPLMRFMRVTTVTALLVLAAGVAAHAHTVRFLAADGDDANSCSRSAPCLTLQRGIDRTPDGSELIILDSGDFGGGATIDKSITISAIGVSASIGGGIEIDGAGVTVVLRGLRLNGAGAAGTGIRVDNAEAVHIVDCEVQNFAGTGISANTSNAPKVFVSGSVVRSNNFDGLFFATGAGGMLTVTGSRFEHNGNSSSYSGLRLQSGVAAISRTVTASNAGDGVRQFGGETAIAWTMSADNGGDGYRVQGEGRMAVENSSARGNATGLRASQSDTVATISNSVFTSNGIGVVQQAGARLWTRGNNTVTGNATNTSGSLSALAAR
jgi:hypothetical protein